MPSEMPDLSRHVVVTRHKPRPLQVWYESQGVDKQELFGMRLNRPFPTAKVQFIEHRDGWMWIYWLCDTLTRPAPDAAARPPSEPLRRPI